MTLELIHAITNVSPETIDENTPLAEFTLTTDYNGIEGDDWQDYIVTLTDTETGDEFNPEIDSYDSDTNTLSLKFNEREAGEYTVSLTHPDVDEFTGDFTLTVEERTYKFDYVNPAEIDSNLSLIHISSPRDQRGSRMPSSA